MARSVMTERNLLRSNVWKIYAVQVAYHAIFFIPVAIPFFQEAGLNLGQVFILQGIFSLALMILEIPSGYLADCWGRQNTIIAGAAFGVIGVAVYSVSYSFWMFALSEILLAVLVSFHSGAIDALMYDTLLELGEERTYRKVAGQQRFMSAIADAVSAVIGGFFAIIALRLTVGITLIPFVLGFGIALLLHEPKRHQPHEARHIKVLWDIVTHTLMRDVPVQSIVLLSGILSSLTLALVWFTQPYQTLVGLPLWLFGIAHAVILLGTGVASKATHRAEGKIDDRILLIIIASIIIGSYLLLGVVTALWGLSLFFVGRMMWGFIDPLTTHIVQRMTSSDTRATVLSIQSFGQRVIFALASPMLGYMVNAFTLNQALLITGGIGGVILLIIFIMMSSVWNRIPK